MGRMADIDDKKESHTSVWSAMCYHDHTASVDLNIRAWVTLAYCYVLDTRIEGRDRVNRVGR